MSQFYKVYIIKAQLLIAFEPLRYAYARRGVKVGVQLHGVIQGFASLAEYSSKYGKAV
jgi:hypothetical protein